MPLLSDILLIGSDVSTVEYVIMLVRLQYFVVLRLISSFSDPLRSCFTGGWFVSHSEH